MVGVFCAIFTATFNLIFNLTVIFNLIRGELRVSELCLPVALVDDEVHCLWVGLLDHLQNVASRSTVQLEQTNFETFFKTSLKHFEIILKHFETSLKHFEIILK